MKSVLSIVLILFSLAIYGQSDTLVSIANTVVYFPSASHEIDSTGMADLDSLLVEVQKIKKKKFHIIGHTDKIGSSEYNLSLSKRRATSVSDYLLSIGVDTQILNTQFEGEKKLFAQQDTETAHQQNRRSEVHVLVNFPTDILSGIIKDDSAGTGVKAVIKMNSRFWSETIDTDENGEFSVIVPRKQTVILDVIAKDYLFESKRIKTDVSEPVEVKVEKLGLGKRANVEQMYFVGNSDIVLPRSYRSLRLLESFMHINSETCIEVRGHINLPNSQRTELNTWHQDLSIARSRRIYNFLIDSGVKPDRMVYRGYGNWEMVYPKANSQEQMALNRRVEIKILDCDKVMTMDNDKIETTSRYYRYENQNFNFPE